VTREWLDEALAAAVDDRPIAALERLCRAAVGPLGVSGVAVTVLAGSQSRGVVCASDDVARRLEELQFTLGEGPGVDAHDGLVPSLERDLASSSRWPAFARAAVEAGVGAVFAIPLRVGEAKLGALVLYRRLPGALSEGSLADAAVLGRAATDVLLALLADLPAGALPAVLEDVSARRAHVHQATGMVSVQLQIPMVDALARLRARAFADGRSLGDVAADVVARRLSFIGD
jgi:hypothetical protein